MEAIAKKTEVECREEVAERLKEFNQQAVMINNQANSFLNGVAVSMGVNLKTHEYDQRKNAFILKQEKKNA